MKLATLDSGLVRAGDFERIHFPGLLIPDEVAAAYPQAVADLSAVEEAGRVASEGVFATIREGGVDFLGLDVMGKYALHELLDPGTRDRRKPDPSHFPNGIYVDVTRRGNVVYRFYVFDEDGITPLHFSFSPDQTEVSRIFDLYPRNGVRHGEFQKHPHSSLTMYHDGDDLLVEVQFVHTADRRVQWELEPHDPGQLWHFTFRPDGSRGDEVKGELDRDFMLSRMRAPEVLEVGS